MKTFSLMLFWAAGLFLILFGDLRLMFIGVFLTIDGIGAQIYLNFQTSNDNLALVGTDMLTITGEIIKRLDALEGSVQNLKE